MVSCDGGGGPLGHPRVYINVDKPQICTCGYCGLPFVSKHHLPSLNLQLVKRGKEREGEKANRMQANEHHREFLQSLPETPYPLEPQHNEYEVPDHSGITGHPFEQR